MRFGRFPNQPEHNVAEEVRNEFLEKEARRAFGYKVRSSRRRRQTCRGS